YRGGKALCEIKNIARGDEPYSAICAETERQLNTAFVEGADFNPFRFFVASGPDSFFLGLAYFHVVADAESVVLLLKSVVEAYRGSSKAGGSKPLDLYPPRWDRLLRSHFLVLTKKVFSLPSLVRDMRNSCRPNFRDPMDLTNRLACCSITPKN